MNSLSKARIAKRRKATEVIVIDDGESASEQETRTTFSNCAFHKLAIRCHLTPPSRKSEQCMRNMGRPCDPFAQVCVGRVGGVHLADAHRCALAVPLACGKCAAVSRAAVAYWLSDLEISRAAATGRLYSMDQEMESDSEVVVIDSESSNDEPVVKIARYGEMEEPGTPPPSPSSEFDEQDQGIFQRAFLRGEVADESVLRAERAEEDLEERDSRIKELSKQLKEANRKAEKYTNKNIKLIHENIYLKEELEDVKRYTSEVKKRKCELVKESVVHGPDTQIRRIVTRRSKRMTVDETSNRTNVLLSSHLSDGDPINVFQLCRPNTLDSITVTSALTQLSAKFTLTKQESWRKYCGECGFEVLCCEVCETVVNKVDVFEHFFTQRHIELVRANDAGVSLPAVQHWLRELQQAAAAAAAEKAMAAMSAAAAAAAAITPAQQQAASMQRCLEKRKGTDAEVITIDDDEPAPPPSAEVIELREMLAKTEDMYRMAIRVAGEAEKRAQTAEDVLESKLAELGKSAMMADSLNEYKDVLILENGQIRSALCETKNSLEAAINAKEELTRENIALKLENHRALKVKKAAMAAELQLQRQQLTTPQVDCLRQAAGRDCHNFSAVAFGCSLPELNYWKNRVCVVDRQMSGYANIDLSTALAAAGHRLQPTAAARAAMTAAPTAAAARPTAMEPFALPQLGKKRKGTEAEVITIDDDEPAPPPSAEVIELREMLAKTEDMYRRAMRVAGEAEKRAQTAEDVLESKLAVLGKSAMMADSLNEYKNVLVLENGQIRSALCEAKNSLEAATNAKEELARANVALNQEIHRLKDIAAELEEERNVGAQQRMRDKANIFELRHKLDMLTKAAVKATQEQKHQPLTTPKRSTVSIKPPAATATISPLSSSSTSDESAALPDSPDSPDSPEMAQAGNAPTKVYDANDPINLFRLCPSNEPWMAPSAVRVQLSHKYEHEIVRKKWKVFCSDSTESYACGVCKAEVRKADVFEHFLSKFHQVPITREKIAQSTLHYWKDQLQLSGSIEMSTALAAEGHKLLPSVAAAAARAAAADRAAAVARMNEEADDDANSSGSEEI
ncbi:hypothetical protein PRIPAC_83918 [Pristionchus pacificus]|uniref:Uncharacterized protein n=1 Tax=Pristionchus pacificus TaxID=54126 RepID=A0A2A6BNP9_PRIPA|nr:hypothetical protein PRIPAC_83918 [Pristionchus pacificus]|eukprot:PDM67529.1 hypothetical protein PRIPAC_48946 [Pristionchus pacificus]